jgi:AraC-like DNA-binding protein
VYHYVTAVSEDACRMTLSVDMLYSEENGYGAHDVQFYRGFPREHLLCVAIGGTSVQEDLEKICSLTRTFDRSYLSVEKLRALSSLLLVDLFALLSEDEKTDMITDIPIRSVQEFTIDTFLGSHFMRNDSSAELARELNVSQRQLHRIMKKAYGMNYREKLKQIRIEIATDFLINTDKTIEQIAEILGYSTAANFSAFVKRESGKTPSQIRKER